MSYRPINSFSPAPGLPFLGLSKIAHGPTRGSNLNSFSLELTKLGRLLA
jgi:hypothetical protein